MKGFRISTLFPADTREQQGGVAVLPMAVISQRRADDPDNVPKLGASPRSL